MPSALRTIANALMSGIACGVILLLSAALLVAPVALVWWSMAVMLGAK